MRKDEFTALLYVEYMYISYILIYRWRHSPCYTLAIVRVNDELSPLSGRLNTRHLPEGPHLGHDAICIVTWQ